VPNPLKRKPENDWLEWAKEQVTDEALMYQMARSNTNQYKNKRQEPPTQTAN